MTMLYFDLIHSHRFVEFRRASKRIVLHIIIPKHSPTHVIPAAGRVSRPRTADPVELVTLANATGIASTHAEIIVRNDTSCARLALGRLICSVF